MRRIQIGVCRRLATVGDAIGLRFFVVGNDVAINL